MKRKNLTTMLRIVQDINLDGTCDRYSIDEMNQLYTDLLIAIEEQDLKDFLIHVQDAMPTDDSEASWDAFYSKPFRISFDCKSVEIPMDATVYQNIIDLLEEYIEDQYLDGRTFVKSRKMYGHMMRIKTDLNRINDAIKDERDPDIDTYDHALYDIKDTMSNIIDELLEIFKS